MIEKREQPIVESAPRVLVVGPQIAWLRACEDVLGRGSLVRTCLGARAGQRAAWTWDPTAIVLDHEPPAIDAAEILRLWHQVGRFVPDVVLYSRAPRAGLETLARRHPGVHVLSAPAGDGELVQTVLAAHRASQERRARESVREGSRQSGTRRRI